MNKEFVKISTSCGRASVNPSSVRPSKGNVDDSIIALATVIGVIFWLNPKCCLLTKRIYV